MGASQVQHHVSAEGGAASGSEVSPPPLPAVADPAPLGLAAFAMTTFVLSCFNAGLMDPKLVAVVLPLGLFYGGMGQLLAGMWEFRNRNTFGALAFTSYGAFWLAFDAYVKYVAPTLPASNANQATGLFLLGWAIFTGYMFIASLKTSVIILLVFLALFLTFLVLAIGALSSNAGLGTFGGWLGIVTALLAWYASFAGVTNATWKRTVLPVGPIA